MSKTIIIGACGQIGTELVLELRRKYGNENVVAADVRTDCPEILSNGPYVKMDILDRESVRNYIIENNVKTVYLLAALLSATAEKNPDFAWRLNMEGLFTILDLAKEKYIDKIFWPSSILDLQLQELIPHSALLRSQQLSTEFQNLQEKGGVNTTIRILEWTFAAYVTLD
jgi:nucleoside-diphosphate-sugar epimerase